MLHVPDTDTPIIFKAEMARRARQEEKTQTRRVASDADLIDSQLAYRWTVEPAESEIRTTLEEEYISNEDRRELTKTARDRGMLEPVPCRYHPGDILWVREPIEWVPLEHEPNKPGSGPAVQFVADEKVARTEDGTVMKWTWENKKLTGRFMAKEFCRTRLEVLDTIAQRIQDISITDIKAEGLTPKWTASDALDHFRSVWDEYHANHPDRQWEANPIVYRVRFQVHENWTPEQTTAASED